MVRTFTATVFTALAVTFAVHAAEPVTVDNFVRAETDMTMKRYVDQGGFGKFAHIRQPTPLDKQDVIRMNRDTLYSAGIFDLTTPVTVVKPDSGDRFQSMLVVSQDHSMEMLEHDAGEFTLTQDGIGSRYAFVIFRTFVDANSEDDIAKANALQDKIEVRQTDTGTFEIPDWDEESLLKLREAINVLAATKKDTSGYFGRKDELNPIDHLLGTAYGWGGNPVEGAVYANVVPQQNDGETPHSVTIAEDVPVDSFWSITIYNEKGYMEPNDRGVNSFNSVTAAKNEDGTVTINAGECEGERPNCIPITKGWNYMVRLYQPREEIISGKWKFPKMKPAR